MDLADSTLGKCERARAQVQPHVVGCVAFSAHLESQHVVLQGRHSGTTELAKSNWQVGLTGLLGWGCPGGAVLSTLPSDLILASYSVNAHLISSPDKEYTSYPYQGLSRDSTS